MYTISIEQLLNNYYQLMEKTSKEVFYASLIETKMINIIINICHYQYVVKYCKRKNIHYVYSLQSKHLRAQLVKVLTLSDCVPETSQRHLTV